MTSPRVLVVDDEADLRELLEITLLKMGLDVDSTETLQQARQHFAEKDYQLVLTDMRLPDGLGLDLVREVTASGKNIPIAVVTAFGSAENAVVALKAGAFDYVSKPVQLEQLRILVQSALRVSDAAPAATPARGQPHTASSALNSTHTRGRSGKPYSLQRMCESSWMQGTPAGLPSGMPGIGLEIAGAVQQAPHCGRHGIGARFMVGSF